MIMKLNASESDGSVHLLRAKLGSGCYYGSVKVEGQVFVGGMVMRIQALEEFSPGGRGNDYDYWQQRAPASQRADTPYRSAPTPV